MPSVPRGQTALENGFADEGGFGFVLPEIAVVQIGEQQYRRGQCNERHRKALVLTVRKFVDHALRRRINCPSDYSEGYRCHTTTNGS